MASSEVVPARADNAAYDALDRAWERSLRGLRPEGEVVVLFSGGVDSGLLAWELRHRPRTTLTTFGVVGSPDLAAARRAAPLLELPWAPAGAGTEEVVRMAQRVDDWVGPLPPTERAIETALALAMEHAPPGHLVCGQGTDELFFGYAHFRGLSLGDALVRSAQDLDRLRVVAWPRTQRVADCLGRTIAAPYLEPGFVGAATALPDGIRRGTGLPKEFFRRWAGHRGLPAVLADRPKKALQYGSGVERLLRRRPPTR